MKSCFILSYKSALEILSVRLKASQLCPGNVNPLQLLLWCQYFWDPLCRQFSHPQDLSKKKSLQAETELMAMDLVMLSEIMRWMASTCGWGFLDDRTVVHLLCCPQPAWIPQPTVAYEGEILTKCLYHALMDFLGCFTFLSQINYDNLRLLFVHFKTCHTPLTFAWVSYRPT